MFFLQKIFKKRQNPKAKPKALRSVVFYRHSYYHFYYLAEALRKRGWDAIVVNLESIDGSNSNYYHGDDINLFDVHPRKFKKNIATFYKEAKKRFRLMHFAGDGCLSFFPNNNNKQKPWDIIQWKKFGNKIAYTVSGCSSATSQTSVHEWSVAGNGLSVCDRCVWLGNKMVCNDEKNIEWGKKVNEFCDLIFSETLPALDYVSTGEKLVRDPTTMCLDEVFWNENLQIPIEHRVQKNAEDILIYHAVGNYDSRNTDTKNIKGTPFIFKAIERLKAEGFPVQLIFLTNKPNTLVRFYQAQADIIVDQLNAGRYGASAREGMMLGKPVICYLNKFEYKEEDKLTCLDECPLVSATEHDIYDVLKELVINSEKRIALGNQGREYALKWHSADKCAERYERYYDRLFGIS